MTFGAIETCDGCRFPFSDCDCHRCENCGYSYYECECISNPKPAEILTKVTPIQDVTLSTEWHVFTDGKWRNYSYAGMPVNIYEDGKWYPIEYRHFANECKNDCTTWNAESIPCGWEDGTHEPKGDYEAGMSWPEDLYRGDWESEARKAIVDYLYKCADYSHVIFAGESAQYFEWAEQIANGASHVRVHGRWYRIRQGVSVNQTHNKGL
jgi:hypothetical protein